MSRILLLIAVAVLTLTIAGPASVRADVSSDNDLAALNYALTLEHLEAAFYTQGQDKFDSSQFVSAGFDAAVYDYFTVIEAHEVAHVNFVTSTITSLGGTPVDACTYNFTAAFASVSAYVHTAVALESTGVSAYDGAINALTNPALSQAAATIATIEARHTSYLLNVTGAVPFPANFDTAVNAADTLTAANGFIKVCSGTNLLGTLPIIRPGGVATMSTLTAAAPSSPSPTSPAPTYNQTQFDADMDTLNFALTLEHLEAGFYAYGQDRFVLADWVGLYGATAGNTLFTNVKLVAAHEAAHVTALKATIEGRGGVAVAACTYNFSTAKFPTLKDWVSTAVVLENTGVQAYDGAVSSITDTGLQQIAATIATVEARHAAWFNGIVGSPATPGNFDTATSRADILTAVAGTGLIQTCLVSGSSSSSSSTGSPASVLVPSVWSAVMILASAATLCLAH